MGLSYDVSPVFKTINIQPANAATTQAVAAGAIDLSSLLARFNQLGNPDAGGASSLHQHEPQTKPSPSYNQLTTVESKGTGCDMPLIVVSIEAVLGASLPKHLAGGHSNFLARSYLQPFADYLLLQKNSWTIAFWTGSMNRKDGLQALKSLKLPTGGPERDERDGVVGLWSKEDTTPGTDSYGQKIGIKDLEVIWKDLYEEEGVKWNATNTIVITANAEEMALQPFNYILAPAFHYKSATPGCKDQFLLMLITVLEVLKKETNFCNIMTALKAWATDEFWTGKSDKQMRARDVLIRDAVIICAKERLTITAWAGN